VLAAPWSIVPADDTPAARERAVFVERAFARMEGSPQTVLLGAMDAFAKGWSVQELVWSYGEGRIWLAAVRPKDPAVFGVEMDAFGRLKGLRLELPGEPARALPREKFVVYANRGAYGLPKGKSDLDAAYRHWQAKSALLEAWQVHLERFAMPTVLGKFDRSIPTEEQSDLLRHLQDLHKLTALTFPNEIDVDTLGGSKEPSTGFMEAIDFHNREISRAVLGQTLTTDEGRRVGSLAMGKVHLQVLLLQLQAIRRELADAVMTEGVIRPLVELNFGPGLVPRFEFAETGMEAFVSGKL
jgi:phage gp29-like protein